jgi:hypothetical protein
MPSATATHRYSVIGGSSRVVYSTDSPTAAEAYAGLHDMYRVIDNEEIPQGRCATAPLDAYMSAGAYLRKEWGDYGYSIGVELAGIGAYLFTCRHSDGSEFFLLSDRYGNVTRAQWNGHAWARAELLAC